MSKPLFEATLKFVVAETPDGRTALTCKLHSEELPPADPDAPGLSLSVAALLALTAYGRFETGLLIKDMEARFGIDASSIKKG